jgi:iron complex outermembrane receptor protein
VEDENLGFLANPELRPEKIRTAELVWEQRLGRRLLQTVSLYEYRMEHLIDQVQVEEELYQFRNTSGARARGLEVQLEARRAGGGQAHARYALQRAEAEDTGKRLTNSPAHQLRLGGGSPLGRYVTAAIQLSAESGRQTLRQSRTNAFWQTDLHLACRPPQRSRLRASLLARNLFNAKYAVPGGLELRQAAIAQEGRNLALRLEYGW